MDIKEAISHNYIGIWPASALFNGVDDVVNFGKPSVVQSIGTSDFYLAVIFKVASRPISIRNIAGPNQNGATTTSRFGIQIRNDGFIQYSLTFGSTLNIDTTHNIAIDDGKVHYAVMNADRDGKLTCYLDGEVVQEPSIAAASAFDFVPARSFRVGAFSSGTDTDQLFFPGHIAFVSFGKRLLTGLEIACPEKIRTTTDSFTCYLNGESSLEYDLTGNEINGTWAGTGNHRGFLTNVYPYALKEGYSLYKKDSNPDIQIPYLFSGLPINNPTVPAGYSLDKNVTGSEAEINLASILMNFNPENRVNANIAFMDRSSATYQTSASRASGYYDSNNPYNYHSSELANYSTYSTFFNTGYENKFFSKVSKISGVVNSIVRMLIYGNNKTSEEANEIKIYCGI